MRLAATRTGPTDAAGPPISFVHGFTQTSRSWQPVIDLMVGSHEFVCVDAPGHGGSIDGRRSLWQCADDITETVPVGVLVGYSMGARMALHSALAHPSHHRGLVLVSGTAGIDDPAERAVRRAADDELADRIERIGTEAFIDEWLSNPLFAGLPDSAAMRQDRLRNTAAGLADSLRWSGTGTQEPLWDRLAGITVPVLVVTGVLDGKFDELGRRLVSLLPDAEHARIEGAGHTVHLERTADFVSQLGDWLADRFASDPR